MKWNNELDDFVLNFVLRMTSIQSGTYFRNEKNGLNGTDLSAS